MGQFGVGQSVKRFEDPRLLRGGGRFINDVNLPGQAHAVVVRSMHAHASDQGHRHRGGAAGSGRRRGVHGRRRGRDGLGTMRMTLNRKRPDGSPMFASPHRGLSQDRARYVGDPDRPGRGRDAGPGRGRRRARPRRLRAAALGDVDGRGHRRRARVGRVPRQRLQPLRGRRQGRRRRRPGRRPPDRAPALRHQPRARPVHGAARRAGRLRSRRGALHALRRRAVSPPRPERAGHQHLQGSRAPDPRDRGRRRRGLRHQGLAVPRAPAGAVGGAQAGPAGEVVVRPARRHSRRRARARQRHRGRAGPRRRGALPGPARAHAGQRGRLRLLGSQPARHLQQRGHAGRRLRLPGRPRRT